MNIQLELLGALDDALGLGGRAYKFTSSTSLFGSLPELDSMAVVDLVSCLEDRFGIAVADEDINAQVFATVASLENFVRTNLPASN